MILHCFQQAAPQPPLPGEESQLGGASGDGQSRVGGRKMGATEDHPSHPPHGDLWQLGSSFSHRLIGGAGRSASDAHLCPLPSDCITQWIPPPEKTVIRTLIYLFIFILG